MTEALTPHPILDHLLQRVIAERKEEVDYLGAHPGSSEDWSYFQVAPRKGTWDPDLLNDFTRELFADFEPFTLKNLTAEHTSNQDALFYPRVYLRFPRGSEAVMEHLYPFYPNLRQMAGIQDKGCPTPQTVIKVDVLPHISAVPKLLDSGSRHILLG